MISRKNPCRQTPVAHPLRSYSWTARFHRKAKRRRRWASLRGPRGDQPTGSCPPKKLRMRTSASAVCLFSACRLAPPCGGTLPVTAKQVVRRLRLLPIHDSNLQCAHAAPSCRITAGRWGDDVEGGPRQGRRYRTLAGSRRARRWRRRVVLHCRVAAFQPGGVDRPTGATSLHCPYVPP